MPFIFVIFLWAQTQVRPKRGKSPFIGEKVPQVESFKPYEDLILQCDQLIKAGDIGAVASLISKLNFAQVPRGIRQALAKTCRRAGLISQGLRLLQPIIRQEKSQRQAEPSEGEICEYAVLLSRNGSIQEAIGLLEKIDSARTPEASLYLGYCHISNWDYAKAILFLETFLKSSAEPYLKLVARVNLAASYIAVARLSEAEQVLNETMELAEKAGAVRLIGNCLQLRGQMHFRRDQFSLSRLDLAQALQIFGETPTYDQLLIRKWQTIMQAIEEGSVAPLQEFRQEALRRKHWESVRESDLFSVKVQYDQGRLDHLVLGTPMPAYRDRIQKEVGVSASDFYILGRKSDLCLDLHSGELSGAQDLNPGKKIHQVLASLVRDFYVPRNMGTLFSELYPDEYFDVESSPLRIRQLLRRTRKWLQENKIPATIQQSRGSYQFAIQGSFGIQIPLISGAIDSNQLKWQQLSKTFPDGASFTADLACERLCWSRSTFLRWSEWALQQGCLHKTGLNKSTRYQVRSKLQSSKKAA